MNKIYTPYNFNKPKESPMAAMMSSSKEPLSQDVKICKTHPIAFWKAGYDRCSYNRAGKDICEELIEE